MGRISHTWELAKSSWHVLQRDRELIALPFVGMIAAALVMGVGLGVVAASGGFDEGGLQGAQIVILALVGITSAVIVQFFAGAVVGGAIERLGGGDPTVSSAMASATRRLTALIGWGAMDWTVGAILRAIRERSGFLGDLVAGLVGMAWGVASFLVLPVIIVEGLGPIDALKRSSSLLQRTWGQNLFAQFGFGFVGIIGALPGVLVGVLVASVIPVLGIAVIIAWVVFVASVVSALTGVFKAVLYRYATEGVADAEFGSELPAAFTRR